MILNWKKEKAGALALPCVQGGSVIKKVFILPGHNDVSDSDWAMIKGQPSVQLLLTAGQLQEVGASKVRVTNNPVAPADLLSSEGFPYKEVVASMKTLEIYKEIADFCKAETGKKAPTKDWLIGYFKDTPDKWELVKKELDLKGDKGATKEVVKGTHINDMESTEATAVIEDTYDMTTLEKWKKEVSKPDLRVLILNQIEEVNKPPRGRA